MLRQDIFQNINIAKNYLDRFHLLIPDEKIYIDCYCFPSFNWKAYYAQVYSENGIYSANCAYTHYADYYGLESYSQHFTAVENDKPPAKNTDIFCKCIFPDTKLINDLLTCAGEYTQTEHSAKGGIVIDGITAGIRLFENGRIARDICLIDPDDDPPLLDKLLTFSDVI